MRVKYFAQLVLATIAVAGEEEGQEFNRRSNDNCDVRHAIHELESLSAKGVAFCTSLLHSSKQPTKTISTTVTKTATCSVRTVTTTEHGTATTFAETTTVLPQRTITEYSSSVLIPSGKSRTVNKRAPAAGPATPSALTTCKPASITTACSSILAPVTTTISTSTTHTKHSCLTTTTSTFTTFRHTTTITFPFSITQPPVIILGTGILTTTVPADCAGPPYAVQDAPFPTGDYESFPEYPDQPQTPVECCVACHHTPNCVASEYFNADGGFGGECGFLIHNTTDSMGVSNICPLGTEDFGFGAPVPGLPDDETNIYPGPCGF